ncbi:DUF1993 domain-containing protein [Bradyrhizobium diazoefficiens]|uniref:DUF1993 domain-containing protein n=1 Tax=Bradyrhizobium diazoefficiens TaxID=1355477 RepID=UPI00190C5242|nr:DUF1993 domain-containing protein [Bradyrhizobium diazoefficiens]QQO33009.1 DUF1993 domain-containing protein [Bradyrhizobium diazoefficiens]
MSLSMYDATVPGMVRSLKNLDAILDKAVAYAEGKKVDPTVLVGSRLAFDMLPFSTQIHRATETARGGAARLAQMDIPSFPDEDKTVAELKGRLAKTVAFLESVPMEKFAGAEDRTVTQKLGGNDMTFPAKQYLFGFMIPNFYFHVTTAYAILRHNGVEIGKIDFLRGI